MGASLGNYIPGNTILHQLDPRVKIFLSATGVILAVSLQSQKLLLILLGICLLISYVGQITIIFLGNLKPFLILILILVFIQAIFIEGDTIFNIGILSITTQGLVSGFILVIKLVIIIFFAQLLIFTTTTLVLTKGLEKLLSPFKRIGLPVHEVVMIMTIALKFIPILTEESIRIARSQTVRGADFNTYNLKRRLNNNLAIIIPIIVSAFRRAEVLALAMEARGYTGGENRTSLYELRLKTIDYTFILVIIGLWVLLFI